jgi:hypothetical protein
MVHPSHQGEDTPHHLLKADTPLHHLRMVVMPLLLGMEVRQLDMEGMYPLLGMVGMFLLLDMELGRRGMIIGDKRQAVRPPSVLKSEAIGDGDGAGGSQEATRRQSSFHRDTIMHQFTAK